MSSRATMREVASLAGVSLKTVSRVVNREPGVSERLVSQVQRATEQLGYRHNLAASNLRKGERTLSMAVLVQDLSNPYSAALLRAIDDLARDASVVVLSASLDEEEARERDLVANLIARRVDGLILMPATASQAYLQRDVSAGFAVVVIDRRPQHLDTDAVLVDNVEGARAATQHLIDHGHRRIGLISDDPSIATAHERRTGYRNALADNGLAWDDSLVASARDVADAQAAVRALMAGAHPPTALFTARNTTTVGAVMALRELGLQHEIALVGFDELTMAHVLDPPLTTVEQHPAKVGQLAASMLLDRLNGLRGEARTVVMPSTLVCRGSGEICPRAPAEMG